MEDLVDGLMEAEMMIKRKRMKLEVAVRTRGEIILIISMIKMIELREEEEEGKDLKEGDYVKNVFIVKKKGMEHLNFPHSKEG